MSTEATIERYIAQNLLYGRNQESISWHKDLFASGLLDSLAVLQLIFFMEEQFGVSCEEDELVPDNFRTINLIKAFVERKQPAPIPVG